MELHINQDNTVRVSLGIPKTSPQDIPCTAPQDESNYYLQVAGKPEPQIVHAINVGNPHAVITHRGSLSSSSCPFGAINQ